MFSSLPPRCESTFRPSRSGQRFLTKIGHAPHKDRCRPPYQQTQPIGSKCSINSSLITASASSNASIGVVDSSDGSARQLLRPAVVIALASLLSKVAGVAREAQLASTFGLQPAYDSYGYASLIPAFLLTIYGGLNGPIHQAATVALAKSSPCSFPRDLEAIALLVRRWSLGIALSLLIAASLIMTLMAPGLQSSGLLQLASLQLQLMAPVALFAGSLGITGAVLQARQRFLLPSLSPAITSLVIIATLTIASSSLWTVEQRSLVLALAYTGGAALQALLQQLALPRTIPSAASDPLDARPPTECVLTVFRRVAAPALMASSLAQLTVQLDLWVASFIPGACAAMGFANLLFMALTGILSSAIVGSLSARLSLAASKSPSEFALAIRTALRVTFLTAFPLTALLLPFAPDITALLFQRGSFSASDTALVSTLLAIYLLSSVPYILREVSARVFYATKAEADVRLPVLLGWLGLALRLPLDWLLAVHTGLGAAGLVLSTFIINLIQAAGCILRLRVHLSTPLKGTLLTLPHQAALYALFASTAAVSAFAVRSFLHHSNTFALGKALLCAIMERMGVSTLAHEALIMWLVQGASVGASVGLGMCVYLSLLFLLDRYQSQMEEND